MRARSVLLAVTLASASVLFPEVRADTPLDPDAECAVETGGTAPAPDGPLRVATFNVLHGLTADSDKTLGSRVALAVDAIIDSGADVVGAQEVSVTNSHGHVAKRLAQGLMQRTGLSWWWCWFQSNPHFPGEPDLRPGGGGGPLTELFVANAGTGNGQFREGVAILSRFPITDSGVRRIAPRSYEAPACVPPDPFACNFAAAFDSRSVLRVRIRPTAGADELDVYTTHVAHHLTELSPVQKLINVQQVLAYVNETAIRGATPDLLVGDFNSVEGDQRHAAVTGAGFVDTFRLADPASRGATSDQKILTDTPEPTATERIDFVFARPGTCGISVPGSRVFANVPSLQPDGRWLWPSDHLAVVSEVACAGSRSAFPAGGSGQGGGQGRHPATL